MNIHLDEDAAFALYISAKRVERFMHDSQDDVRSKCPALYNQWNQLEWTLFRCIRKVEQGKIEAPKTLCTAEPDADE